MLLGRINRENLRRWQKNAACAVMFTSSRGATMFELMAAADLLLHPAYQEAAGIVLLEAITAGLPVLTTAVCGYAHYIVDANCGEAIAEPFRQEN
ncbi:glycosyltransferase [Escherichia coli]